MTDAIADRSGGELAASVLEAEAELRHCVDELRELASGIHPAVLSDLGLAAAIESLAEGVTARISLVSAPDQRLPTAVETAAQLVVAEAAKVGAVTVNAVRDGLLVVDVDAASAPARLVDLEDRVGALDGSLTVNPAPEGVRIRAEIPCGQWSQTIRCCCGKGLARLLAEAGCDIVGKAADASQLMELVAEVQPDVARLIKADVGLRVATVDVGGWDLHTDAGRVDSGAMTSHLTELSSALAAFAIDLGARLDDVTVVTMSEFGRRVQQNGSGGTDHGHGNVIFLLGGGVAGGRVHGSWRGLAPEALIAGDLAGPNDYSDVLAEVSQRQLGLGSVDPVFPDHRYTRLGVMRR